MRKLLAAVVVAFLAAPSWGQFVKHPPYRAVADLGTCTDGQPKLVYVTDGASSTDCATGGGSTEVLCACEDGAWAAVSAGGGGGTPGGSNTEIQYNNASSFGGVSQLTYDGTNLTLAPVSGDDVAAEELVAEVYNNTGATLFKCTAVYISGFNIPNDLVEVSIADSDDAAKMPAVGLVRADIADGTAGFLVTAGDLFNADTTTGEGWTVGDPLYVNASGTATSADCGESLTNVKPTGAGLIQLAGIVARVNPANGVLELSGFGQSNDIPNITDDSIWQGNSSGVATATAVPDCDSGSGFLNYDTTTNAWSCNAESGGISNVVEDTTPQLGGQLDVNGNAFGDGTLEILKFGETVSAVNEVTITNAATGNGPSIAATGDDANVDLNIQAKGSGLINLDPDADSSAEITIASNGDTTFPQVNDAVTPTINFGDGDTGFYEVSDDYLVVSMAGAFKWSIKPPTYPIFSEAGTGAVQINQGVTSATDPGYTFSGDSDTGIGRAGADDLSIIAGGQVGIDLTEATNVVTATIADTIIATEVASAVNEVTVTSAATGSGPSIAATGDDANVDLTVSAKAAGTLTLEGGGDANEGVVIDFSDAGADNPLTIGDGTCADGPCFRVLDDDLNFYASGGTLYWWTRTAPTALAIQENIELNSSKNLNWSSDTDTNISHPAADQLDISAGGQVGINLTESASVVTVTIDDILASGSQATTLGAAATTFAVVSNFVTLTGDAGANTISTITGGATGMVLRILFVDGLVTITDTDAHTADTVDLSAAFTSADDTVLTLIFDGNSWYEVSRSAN